MVKTEDHGVSWQSGTVKRNIRKRMTKSADNWLNEQC